MERLLGVVRGVVSADKNRYQEGATNLDLTYITERLIAMSFPAEGFESSYRNDINEVPALGMRARGLTPSQVARFLKEKHPGNFMVFNLCSERGYNYALLDNNVQAWCGFPDHHAPPLALLLRICHTMHLWLTQSPDHVAVVHCKAGKGRTGTVISSYLVYCGLFGTASLALDYFARRRSSNMFGVSSPAQRRYVAYAADLFTRKVVPPTRRLILARVTLSGLPTSLELLTGQSQQQLGDLSDVFSVEVHQGKQLVHHSHGIVLCTGPGAGAGALECVFAVNAIVHADVQLDVYASRQGLLGGKRAQKCCFVQFNCSMLAAGASTLVFSKADCDKVAFDRRFPATFQLSALFEDIEAGSLSAVHANDDPADDDVHRSVAAACTGVADGAAAFFASGDVAAKLGEARKVAMPIAGSGRRLEKAGWLCKMGLNVRSWQDRWFILRGGTLSYYKSPKNASPNGVIPLQSVLLVTLMRDKVVEVDQPHKHSLVLRTSDRDYVLCANDVLDLEEWHEALQESIQE